MGDGFPTGWHEEWFDGRDRYYVPQHRVNVSELKKINLRTHDYFKNFFRPIYDQGAYPTCVANACAAAFAYAWKRQGFEDIDPSRFFIFYSARSLGQNAGVSYSNPDDNKDLVTGTFVRLAMKVLKDSGVCDDIAWKYAENDNFGHVPSDTAKSMAKRNVSLDYARIDPDNPGNSAQTLNSNEQATIGDMALLRLRQCLAEGYPVVFGLYFPRPPADTIIWNNDAQEWVAIDLPAPSSRDNCGGHAVLAIGYHDEKKRIICQNSWGENNRAIFYLGYDWIRDFTATADFWTLRLVAKDGNRGDPIQVPGEVILAKL